MPAHPCENREAKTRAARAALLTGIACSAFVYACGPQPEAFGRVVDLSHAYDGDTIFWPTEEGFVLERGTAGVTEAGYWYVAHRFRTPEHGGTHIDAPIHFAEGGQSVDEIPLDRLMVETDAPFLAPQGHRGRRNEPLWVSVVGETLAALHESTAEQLAARTTQNARTLFRLPGG